MDWSTGRAPGTLVDVMTEIRIRWVSDSTDADEVHATDHDADTWHPCSAGPVAARRIQRRMARVTRHQRDRDAHEFGYRVLGEAGA